MHKLNTQGKTRIRFAFVALLAIYPFLFGATFQAAGKYFKIDYSGSTNVNELPSFLKIQIKVPDLKSHLNRQFIRPLVALFANDEANISKVRLALLNKSIVAHARQSRRA